jgi:uncharacterized protein YeaO (DUF488 family)
VSATSDNIRLKRIYEPKSPKDGHRILVTRYWPRGIRKDATDEYNTTLAPSRQLVQEFKHEGLSWGGYVPRFLEEMRSDAAKNELRRLADVARSQPMTLMCMCEDERRCHRSLLRELILAEARQPAASTTA